MSNWVNITPCSKDGTWIRVDQIIAIDISRAADVNALPTNVFLSNGKVFRSDYGTDELMARLKELEQEAFHDNGIPM